MTAQLRLLSNERSSQFRSVAPPDLPPSHTGRWSPQRKAQVITAIRAGLLSPEVACERYKLSSEELKGWEEAVDRHGVAGLKVTGAERRASERQAVHEACEARFGPGTGFDCEMVDLGPGGARIKFRRPVRVPKAFELRCTRTGRAAWVEIVLQSDRTVGVRFRAPPAAPLTVLDDMHTWLIAERD